MNGQRASSKSRKLSSRPPFERIALVLQGGGALGSYQAGVYQALSEADLHPDWVAGISIGAVNAALIAGNPPEKRVEALQAFWEQVTSPPVGIPSLVSALLGRVVLDDDFGHGLVNDARAFATMAGGAPGFFTPRSVPPFFSTPGTADAQSFYDVSPLKATLERLVDFDRINSGEMRFSVGAVNVRTGNFAYFDNTTDVICAEHVMASGSLPPGFPATTIDGEQYWDGGLVSNTPLLWVLDTIPRKDTLTFQIDLWCARGNLPRDLMDLDLRQKDIRYSSRTRMATDYFKKSQRLRRELLQVLKMVPPEQLDLSAADRKQIYEDACEKVFNIVHLIYRAKAYEGSSKDYEFSRRTMEEHWASGYDDALDTLRHPEIMERPTSIDGVETFDFADTTPG